jgi:hypothetical protein
MCDPVCIWKNNLPSFFQVYHHIRTKWPTEVICPTYFSADTRTSWQMLLSRSAHFLVHGLSNLLTCVYNNLHVCLWHYWDLLIQTFWNSSHRAGRKSQGSAILPSMPVRVSDKFFCLCILFCTGNRKCNWYAETITVNSELRFCFKWHLLLKHATVSMVILLIIVFL